MEWGQAPADPNGRSKRCLKTQFSCERHEWMNLQMKFLDFPWLPGISSRLKFRLDLLRLKKHSSMPSNKLHSWPLHPFQHPHGSHFTIHYMHLDKLASGLLLLACSFPCIHFQTTIYLSKKDDIVEMNLLCELIMTAR